MRGLWRWGLATEQWPNHALQPQPTPARLTLCPAPRPTTGIPVSTSHICVFAAVAVGLYEGRKGVNWWMVLQTIMAMFITLGTAMGACAGLTAFGIYSPMKNLENASVDGVNQWNQ